MSAIATLLTLVGALAFLGATVKSALLQRHGSAALTARAVRYSRAAVVAAVAVLLVKFAVGDWWALTWLFNSTLAGWTTALASRTARRQERTELLEAQRLAALHGLPFPTTGDES